MYTFYCVSVILVTCIPTPYSCSLWKITKSGLSEIIHIPIVTSIVLSILYMYVPSLPTQCFKFIDSGGYGSPLEYSPEVNKCIFPSQHCMYTACRHLCCVMVIELSFFKKNMTSNNDSSLINDETVTYAIWYCVILRCLDRLLHS